MRYFDTIAEFERDGFDIVVDKTYEDMDPWDSLSACFGPWDSLSECFNSKRRLYNDIDSGKYEWFMLRVRALVKGREMACTYLGGCLYEDAGQVVTDGTVEDLLSEVLPAARVEAEFMQSFLKKLLDKEPA